MEKVKKVVIDRRRWLRGEGSKFSRLLRKYDQKMCCLGFYCKQVHNISDERLEGFSTLNDVGIYPSQEHGFAIFPLPYLDPRSRHTHGIYDTNDAERINNSEREVLLIELFKANGIELTFEN